MSGICGIYHSNGQPVKRTLLESMTGVVPWRGPDGIHHRVSESLGMAHLALHTTPESQYEHQPMVADNGQLWITAHARVDNRRELIAQLGPHLNNETTITDVDLILAAYRRWETDCPQHLIGDFAFALWDAQRRRLLAARDHMGVHPLYYTWNGHTFAWGTEVKQLLTLPWISRELNERMIGLHLCAHPGIPDETFYVQVSQLPPASCIVIENRQLSVKKYWKLDPYKVLELPSDDDYAEAFRELFYQAVETRLRRITPVGIALSGGLDSSAVACVAADLLGPEETRRSLHAYTITSDEVPAIDEREYARSVVEKWGIPWTQISADEMAPLQPLPPPAVAVDRDDPLALHYEAWLAAILSALQAKDVRIFMEGHPGDNLIGLDVIGYDELFWKGQWNTLFRRFRAHRKLLGHPAKYLFREAVLKPVIPPRMRAMAHRIRHHPLNEFPWLNRDFYHRNDLVQYMRQTEAPIRGLSTSKNLRYSYTAYGILPQTFVLTERFAGRYNMESRHPWTDVRLVEFAMALPVEQTFCNGHSKLILRRSLGECLPDKVSMRLGKTVPSPWLNKGLRRTSRTEVEYLIEQSDLTLENCLDSKQIRLFYKHFLHNERIDEFPLWYILTASRWLMKARYS